MTFVAFPLWWSRFLMKTGAGEADPTVLEAQVNDQRADNKGDDDDPDPNSPGLGGSAFGSPSRGVDFAARILG